jgi:hypothetical protein
MATRQRRNPDDPKLTVSEDEAFEMSNLFPRHTGLAQRIWISVNISQRHARPQLRVEWPDKRFYPLSLDEPVMFLAGRPPGLPAAQFKDLRRFVTINRDVLLAHWHDQIGSEAAVNGIQHV